MRINENRIRQIIKEEAKRVLREADDDEGSAAEADGAARWTVGDEGYTLSDAPRDVADAWYNFTVAVAELEPFMNDTFPDTEDDGKPATIGDIAVHQVKTFLTER